MPGNHSAPRSVVSERRDGILLLTINRPEARNAVNDEVAMGIGAAMDRLDEDARLQAAVITGAGKGFCAGMDLKALLRGEKSEHPVRGFAGIVRRPPTKPIIAAVEGFALAGGFEIALACDLIVAARGARFGLPEVKRSLVASAGGMLRLPDAVPRALAVEMLLTGDPVSAERLADVGALARIAEPGQAVDEALALAGQITANAPLSLRAVKRVLAEKDGWSLEERWQRQQEIAAPVAASQDAREGARAFAERRAPRWIGC